MTPVPPGRAGRLWLRQRIGTAERAVGLLRQKLAALTAERDARRRALQAAEQAWRERADEADRSMLRAALLDGRRTLALAARDPVPVTVEHGMLLGVVLPARAVLGPEPDVPSRVPDGAALEPARRSARAAMEAGAARAVADGALAALDAEIEATRWRLRAIEHRRLPELRAALARVELTLEEREREDGARLRRATAEPERSIDARGEHS
ncbi:V-type ATP synthase subunit D [Actinomadura gamaensis]|uniref:V-type ATP synthase subunit D n=1 Tax=Actinomadura gamaensis TaxID=1763541 RepID=A0ABV9TU20_9ACTN